MFRFKIFKTFLHKVVRRYRFARNFKIEHKKIKRSIRNYQKSIPRLSKYEKDEIRKFWKGKYGISFPLDWHRFFYGTTGVKDWRYIPEPIFHQNVKPFFNRRENGLAWGDKCYLDRFIPECKTVRSIIRNADGRFMDEHFELIDIIKAQSVIDQFQEIVIKPSMNTDTGKGVQLLKNPYDLKKINEQYKRNYVIQIPLQQHMDMAKLNASSVNTIRVNSVLFETDAHIMSAFVKVGQAGEFADNHGHDRFFIGIYKDGTFCDYAINHDLKRFESIPSGYHFAGKKVPSFEKICALVKEAHKKIAHFGFAFWDICINEKGEPVIVEVNLRYPDTVIPQACGIGGFLGDYTEAIIERCKK